MQLTRDLSKRMAWYWRMEAANIVIVPGSVVVIIVCLGGTMTSGVIAATAAVAYMLMVGAVYWHAQTLRRLSPRSRYARTVRRLARAKLPALALLGLSAYLLLGDVATPPHSFITRFAGWSVWLVALAEFINYYVVQLQHFDNRSDFSRLLRGQGFRRSHLARDIVRLRQADRRQNAADTPQRS